MPSPRPPAVDRTDGYVTAVGYTHGYHAALNPLRARLMFLNTGLAIGPVETACELGFGQGVSLACHAAASPTRWHGNDFNPEHVAFARELAAAADVPIGLHPDSFEAFAGRSDLPDFDYIGMHGVWSWVSDRNRAAILAFIERRLKPGGIVYVGYNAFPGWAPLAPIRHMLVEHASRAEAFGRGIVERVDQAVAFVGRLLASEPAYGRDNPQIADWFETLKDADRRYLAHEYFNDAWAPMYFAEVARELAPAGLAYACSATFAEHLDGASLSPAQRDSLREIGDPLLRESTRDFMVNRGFRQDYWVRGPRTLSGPERIAALRAERVVLSSTELPRKVRAILALNPADWNAACGAVLDLLADHKPRTLGEIEQALDTGNDLARIVDAVVLIAGCGNLMAAQDDAVAAAVRPRTDALNAHLIERARAHSDVQHLASPLTGGGLEIAREHQLFLSALKRGKTRPEQWIADAAACLALPSDDETLREQATVFATDGLPLLRAFQIV